MTDEKVAVVKAIPAIFGFTIYSLTFQEWVAVATLVYIALQVGLLLPKYWRLIRTWRRGDKSEGEL